MGRLEDLMVMALGSIASGLYSEPKEFGIAIGLEVRFVGIKARYRRDVAA